MRAASGGSLQALSRQPLVRGSRTICARELANARTREGVVGLAAAVHELRTGLYVIEGHHPESMWNDVNVPNIAAVHSRDTLYLLDTGLGQEQKRAILELAGRLRGAFSRLVLLNSHGHGDHVGNNDVIDEIGASDKSHYISEKSDPYFDPFNFFRDAYNEGARYFNYLEGLDITVDALMPLLVRAGVDANLDRARLAELGRLIEELGMTTLISHYWGDLMMRNVAETYPEIHMSLETMRRYETLGRETFQYGDARWTGWTFGAVQVFEGHGHTPDGVLFYVPEHKFLFFADETTAVPVWKDTNTDNTADSFRKTLAMVEEGMVETVAAGHFPMQVVTNAEDVRKTVSGMLEQKLRFDREVTEAVAQFPEGVSIDRLYTHLREHAEERGVIASLLQTQFPKMPSFLKLILLNFCRRHLHETEDEAGHRVFRAQA
jgi:glyoxylase-like metal-dependent hydrolase (beta-lactamase superfamily II)